MNLEMTMDGNRLNIDTSKIFADVYHQNDKGVYYAKVSFPDLGLYINSWTIRQSDKYPEKGLWVQPPSFYMGKRWIKVLEFRNDSELFDLIREEILRAVDRWEHEKAIPDDDNELRRSIDEIFPD